MLAASGIRKSSRYVVRVVEGGPDLARQTGLVDREGRPGARTSAPRRRRIRLRCRGRVAWSVLGARFTDRAGALLRIGGDLPLVRRSSLALVGAARRLGIAAKAREVQGIDRVVIRDSDAIGAMLTRLGAHDASSGLGGAGAC